MKQTLTTNFSHSKGRNRRGTGENSRCWREIPFPIRAEHVPLVDWLIWRGIHRGPINTSFYHLPMRKSLSSESSNEHQWLVDISGIQKPPSDHSIPKKNQIILKFFLRTWIWHSLFITSGSKNRLVSVRSPPLITDSASWVCSQPHNIGQRINKGINSRSFFLENKTQVVHWLNNKNYNQAQLIMTVWIWSCLETARSSSFLCMIPLVLCISSFHSFWQSLIPKFPSFQFSLAFVRITSFFLAEFPSAE